MGMGLASGRTRGVGELAVNGERVSPAALGDEVRHRLARDPERVVFFDAGAGAPHGAVVHAMDVVKGAGAAALGIVGRDRP